MNSIYTSHAIRPIETNTELWLTQSITGKSLEQVDEAVQSVQLLQKPAYNYASRL